MQIVTDYKYLLKRKIFLESELYNLNQIKVHTSSLDEKVDGGKNKKSGDELVNKESKRKDLEFELQIVNMNLQRIDNTINSLDLDEKMVFKRFYFDGWSKTKIVTMMEIPLSRVTKHLKNAKQLDDHWEMW